MKQKLLEALKAKFQGVNANVLDRIAEKLAKTVTTDEEGATALAGVTKDFIDIIESYGDSRATEAQQTAVRNYEEKYGLKDGRKTGGEGGSAGGQAGGSGSQQQRQEGAGDGQQVPGWAQAITEGMKKLGERLDRMDGERTSAARRQKLSAIIGKLPEGLRKAYERTPVEDKTDEQFEKLMGEIKTEVDGMAGMMRARGAVFGRPTVTGGQGGQGGELTKEQREAIAHRDSKPRDGQPF